MAVFKNFICTGITHLCGERDYDAWVRHMINDLGPEVKPFLRDVLQWSLISIQGKKGSDENKLNCWEIRQCGFVPGDDKSKKDNCPACMEVRLDGIHGGKNGGRACWVINGTRCDGSVQRSFRKKKKRCNDCSFYKTVLIEEDPGFVISPEFIRMLIDFGL